MKNREAASTNPPDVDALGLRLGHAEAEGVHGQRRHPKQLHGGADQAGGDDVVHKEGAVVGEEDAPAAVESGKMKKIHFENNLYFRTLSLIPL